MRLTVLGCSGSWPSATGPASGYLVGTDTTTVLVDPGNGSSANLHRLVDLTELDGVLVSHAHPDHCVDLVGLHHAIRYGTPAAAGIPLWAPPEVPAALAALMGDPPDEVFDGSFDVRPAHPGDVVEVGDITVALVASVHPVPTLSMRFEAGGRVLTYSADSAGGDGLVAAARGADLFLCEATWQGDSDDLPGGIHLTARDAGRVATAAGVGRLLLTHVQGGLDREVSRGQAAETFTGPIDLAEVLATVEV